MNHLVILQIIERNMLIQQWPLSPARQCGRALMRTRHRDVRQLDEIREEES